jgi:excisionase family DNA binding protein
MAYAETGMGEHISAVEASRRTGISEKTIRRLVQSGKLKADKRGRAFRIPVSELVAVIGRPVAPIPERTADTGLFPASGRDTGQAIPVSAERDTGMGGLAELARLVGRLQEENRNLAGQLGYYQAKLQQAEETIRALEAPREAPTVAPESHTASNLTAPPRSRPGSHPSPTPSLGRAPRRARTGARGGGGCGPPWPAAEGERDGPCDPGRLCSWPCSR